MNDFIIRSYTSNVEIYIDPIYYHHNIKIFTIAILPQLQYLQYYNKTTDKGRMEGLLSTMIKEVL